MHNERSMLQGFNRILNRDNVKRRKDENTNAHCAFSANCSMSSPHPQTIVVIESETESESSCGPETDFELESQPDGYYMENQLGLPENQQGVVRSSSPPRDVNIDCNKSKSDGECFSQEVNGKN